MSLSVLVLVLVRMGSPAAVNKGLKISTALFSGPAMIRAMNKVKRKRRTARRELQSGQVWRMADTNLHIELVGTTLVHYKLFKPNVKRTPTSMSVKRVVEDYLKKNKAVLVN